MGDTTKWCPICHDRVHLFNIICTSCGNALRSTLDWWIAGGAGVLAGASVVILLFSPQGLAFVVKGAGEGRMPVLAIAGFALIAGLLVGWLTAHVCRLLGISGGVLIFLVPVAGATGFLLFTQPQALGALGAVLITFAVLAILAVAFGWWNKIFRKR